MTEVVFDNNAKGGDCLPYACVYVVIIFKGCQGVHMEAIILKYQRITYAEKGCLM